MDFSNTTTNAGIVQDVDYLVNSTRATLPLTTIASSANRAMDEVISIILGSDGRWQFDDTNYTDLPIGTTGLVANQQDYSFDPEQIDVTRVEVKDENGNWRFLVPMDQKDLNPTSYAPLPSGTIGAGFGVDGQNYSLTDFMKVAGTPLYYDKIANSIFLYPKPSYTQSASLKVYFQRKPSYFVSTDTTKQPGFAKHLHRIISYKVAYDYAVAKLLTANKLQSLMNEIAKMEQRIREFYSSRKKDEKVVLVARNTASV